MMKRNLSFVTLILSIIGLIPYASAQTTDKRIDEIKRLYEETNSLVAASEKEGEYTSTYTVELAVNKVGAQYPAVGPFSHIAKFYYTFGDREKNPYPDRLMKINVSTRRSAAIVNSEFLYNASGQLVFAYVSTTGDETRETRLYFAAGQLIKMLNNEKDVNVKLRSVLETAQAVKAESTRLTGIFKASLKEAF
ncbi:MAG TPA: hypothetical protein VK612_13180 [Pyrinomonadaceae bacterium]|nr:hypothetical protein [Pyrinomonadaceae bacterium]